MLICAALLLCTALVSAGCITTAATENTAASGDTPLLGFVGALSDETELILSDMQNKEEKSIGIFKFTKGTCQGIPCVVGTCGVGKIYSAACTQAMIDLYHPANIVNIGVGGALNADLRVGDLVIAEETVIHDFDETPLGNEPGQLWENKLIYIPCDEKLIAAAKNAAKNLDIPTKTGITATGDQFIEEPEDKLRLEKDYNALVCDMEGAAVTLVCYENGVPCVVCRTISDTRDGDSDEYEANVDAIGEKIAKLGEELLLCLAAE